MGITTLKRRSLVGATKVGLFFVIFTNSSFSQLKPKAYMVLYPIALVGLNVGLFMDTLKYLSILVTRLLNGRERLTITEILSMLQIMVYLKLTRRPLKIQSIKATSIWDISSVCPSLRVTTVWKIQYKTQDCRHKHWARRWMLQTSLDKSIRLHMFVIVLTWE